MEETFWDRFLAYHEQMAPLRRGRKARETPVCADVITLGNSAEESDELVQRIIEGSCTAVITTLSDAQQSGRPIPRSGEYRVLMNGSGHPCCVLRSERAAIIPLRDMTWEIAQREGTDATFSAWQRRTHAALLQQASAQGRSFSLDELMLADLFTLSYFEDGEI